MTSKLLIGCGQITWRGVPEEQVLAEIAQAGYVGAPAGPKADQSAAEVIATFTRYGLKPAPGYLGADYWDKSQEAAILQRARDYAAFAKAAGCTELYVAAGGFNNYVTKRGLTRMQIAGHVKPEDNMTDAEYAQFANALNQVGEITLAQGVKSCFHNHVGSTIETREEIDQLWRLIDPGLVFMGPDTGHLAWAGADVVQFCRDYASSIKTMHIKDVNKQVMDEGVAAQWDYRTFSDKGIWTELGQGCVDFPTVFQILADAGFGGWLIVETDVTQLPTPLESAIISRNYLRGLGL
ncbi:MAG: sugar phosphate isomerase/epimerase family protein [Caldilineaceae bacterium]